MKKKKSVLNTINKCCESFPLIAVQAKGCGFDSQQGSVHFACCSVQAELSPLEFFTYSSVRLPTQTLTPQKHQPQG